MRVQLFFRGLVAAFSIFGVLPATAAVAQNPHFVLRDFAPTSDYVLEVDGRPDNAAEIYISQKSAALLVRPSVLEEPLLIWARSKRVDALTGALLERGNVVDLAEDIERTYLGDFSEAGTGLSMPVEGHTVLLLPRPPLLGNRSVDELFEHSPGYRTDADAYQPDAAVLAKLRSAEGVELKVFFGSWCHVCKTFMPNCMRVERELAGSSVKFQYYGLELPPEGWQDEVVQEHEITGLPTAVVYVGGKEVGRIVGAEGFKAFEQTLADLL